MLSRRVRWSHFMDAYKQITQFPAQFVEHPQLPSPIFHMQKLTEFLKPAGSRGVIRCAGDVGSGAWKWRTQWVRNGEKKESSSNHPIPHNGIWIWTWFSCKRNQPTNQPFWVTNGISSSSSFNLSCLHWKGLPLTKKGRSLNQDDVSASPKDHLQHSNNLICHQYPLLMRLGQCYNTNRDIIIIMQGSKVRQR